MNRQQLRKATKLTPSELAALIEREKQLAINYAVQRYSAAVALVLRDKLGFGKTRLHRTINHIITLFDDILEDRLSFEDIEKVLDEECDVIIRYKK